MQNVRPDLRRTHLAPPPTALSQAVRSSLGPVNTPFPGAGGQFGAGQFGGCQSGFGLMETLLVITAGALLAGGVYALYNKTSQSQQVANERENVGAIAEKVMRIYSGRNTFSLLTNTNAIAQGVYPAGMVPRESGFTGAIKNSWGGTVGVQGATVNAAPGVTNNAFTITYGEVPSSVCTDFATSAGNGFYEVTVRKSRTAGTPGQDIHTGSVLSSTNKNRVDPALAANRCASGNLVDVAFTYMASPVARTTCAGAGPIPPNDDAQTASCPMGSNGLPQLISDAGPDQYSSSWQQTRTQNGSCGPSGLVVWGPWSPWDPTHSCANQCVDVTTPMPDETRPASCPAGQVVSTPGGFYLQPGWTQTRSVTASQTCTTPIGPLTAPATSYGSWGPNLTCATVCTPTSTPETGPAPCPPGQMATTAPYGSTSGTRQRTITRTCSSVPFGTLGAPVPGPWGPPQGQSCAPACTTVNGTQTEPAPCPAGQISTTAPYGPTSGTRTRSTTQTCSTPVGPLNPVTYGPWGAPQGQSCALPCTPTTTPQSQPGTCPAGTTGSWTQTRTITMTCANPVTPGTPVTSPWSPATAPPGACVSTCGPAPAPGNRTVPCPAGQTGIHTQTHTWNAAAAPTCWTAAPWTTVSNTCAPTPPACGPAPPPGYQNWGCPAGQTGDYYRTHGWNSVAPPTCWSAQPWTTVNTCVPSGPSSCTNPAPSGPATCPAGQSGGSWTQAPYPGCSWTVTGCSTSSCTNPAPSGPATCPAGQSGGSWTRSPYPGCTWSVTGCAPTPPGHYTQVSACSAAANVGGGLGSPGGAVRDDPMTNCTEAFVTEVLSNAGPYTPSGPFCSATEMWYISHGYPQSCVYQASTPAVPATCVVGQTFYRYLVWLTANGGQSGNLEDSTVDAVENFYKYSCIP